MPPRLAPCSIRSLARLPRSRQTAPMMANRFPAVAARQPDPPVAVIIPPRVTAVPSPVADTAPTQRDQHIRVIQDRGRMGWQKAVGYGRRSLGETAVFRYKRSLVGGFGLGLCLPR